MRTRQTQFVRTHGLRRSFASTAVSGGDSLYLVGKVLRHRQSRTTERAAHLKDDPPRAVANRASEAVAAIMQGSAGSVALFAASPTVRGSMASDAKEEKIVLIRMRVSPRLYSYLGILSRLTMLGASENDVAEYLLTQRLEAMLAAKYHVTQVIPEDDGY